MKITTIKAVTAYNLVKDMKMSSLSDDVLLKMWRNMRLLRPVCEEYDKCLADVRKTLEDDEYRAMTERLIKAQQRELELKENNRSMTSAEYKEVQEINAWFRNYEHRCKSFIEELNNKELEIAIERIPADEMVKALKGNDKTFKTIEELECIIG